MGLDDARPSTSTASTAPCSVNAGFMVGHSALRRVVMGERSVGERARPTTSSTAMVAPPARVARRGRPRASRRRGPRPTTTRDGEPVPSRHATAEELLALCRVTGEHPGTSLEFIPTTGDFTERHLDLMARMSAAAGRPLNWNLLTVQRDERRVRASSASPAGDYAARAWAAKVVALDDPEPPRPAHVVR